MAEREPAGPEAGPRRGLARLIVAEGISVTGDWVLNTAAAIAVFHETGSTAAVSLLLAFALVPTVFVAPLAGAMADRRDRRAILVTADLASALLLITAATVSALGFELVAVYAAVLALAILAAFRRPAADALRPAIAGDEHIVRANSMIQTAARLAMIAGPAAASGLMSAGGLELALTADAMSFVASALLVLGVARTSTGEDQPYRSPFRAAADGLRFARRSRGVRTVVLAIGITMVAAPVVNAGTLTLVRDELALPESRYGLLLAVEGAGALALALLLTTLGPRLRLLPVGVAAVLTTGASTILVGAAPEIATAMAGMAAMGMGVVAFQISFTTYLQRETPDEFRGRVMSLASMTAAVAGLAGFALAGPLVYEIGVRQAFWLSGGLICLTALPVLGLLLMERRETLARSANASAA